MEIQGELITLRTAKLEAQKLIYEMGLSTDYMRKCFEEGYPEGLETFKKSYTERYFDNREPYVCGGVMICLDNIPVGFISYGQISDPSYKEWVYHFGTMELDIWMDGEKNCGKGYGVDAITTLSDYLHEKYNIDLFMICPARINPRAIHSYEKAGFNEVSHDEKHKVL